MEQFRKSIQIRIKIFSLLSLFTALFGVYNVFFVPESLKSLEVYEFQTGLFAAICILSSINIIKYKKLLEDNQKLRIEFNKENDERYKVIKSKAGIPMIPILSVFLLIIGIMAGYSNLTVFYTLITIGFCQMLISALIKLFYLKIM